MKHILSSGQFDRATLDHLMLRAREMENIVQQGGSRIAQNKILATLFYEPSTRTRLSFESAMRRLGGGVISETDVTFSSQAKGEVLADTIRIVSGYSDLIALRSKNKGDADLAAEYASVPVINAGDGPGEHPTQALLDLSTMDHYFDLKDQEIVLTFVGDLKYGRTVHSVCTLMRHYPNIRLNFVAPEELQIPETYLHPHDGLFYGLGDEVLAKSDVIYATRIQKERFADLSHYEALKDSFIFNPEVVSKMKPTALLMHPLPRVNEITQEVDTLPQAKYFEQARNGLYVRMALIAELLGL